MEEIEAGRGSRENTARSIRLSRVRAEHQNPERSTLSLLRQLGTEATPADDNFDQSHSLYNTFRELADVREDHEALCKGAQIHRYSESGSGVYAFSRIDRGEQTEYIVAASNSESAETATFDTYSPRTGFEPVYGEMTVEVPPLSTVVYRADAPSPDSEFAPGISMEEPELDEETGRIEVGAELSEDRFSEVTFGVKAGNEGKGKGGFEPIGTDDNSPYRVFYDASEHESGTPLPFRAVVHDMNGNYRSSETVSTTATGEKGTL